MKTTIREEALGGLREQGLVRIPPWKRGLDWLVILAACPVWLPASIVCMIWIKLVSAGPLFYSQERVGLNGQTFRIFKFRSMKVGEGSAVHEKHLSELIGSDKPMTKLDTRDSRLIPGGRILRASGLDELPQLINVMRGEMSVVGPRPCTPWEFENFNPCCMKRFHGLPGITGLWQVSGKNRTTFRHMIALDILYVRQASLLLDIVVLLKTLPAILTQLYESISSKSHAPEVWNAKRRARRDARREARRTRTCKAKANRREKVRQRQRIRLDAHYRW